MNKQRAGIKTLFIVPFIREGAQNEYVLKGETINQIPYNTLFRQDKLEAVPYILYITDHKLVVTEFQEKRKVLAHRRRMVVGVLAPARHAINLALHS